MFMFQETELETEKRRDKKWLKKVDRTQNSKVGIIFSTFIGGNLWTPSDIGVSP